MIASLNGREAIGVSINDVRHSLSRYLDLYRHKVPTYQFVMLNSLLRMWRAIMKACSISGAGPA